MKKKVKNILIVTIIGMLIALIVYPVLYIQTASQKDKITEYTQELLVSTEKTKELEDAEKILIEEGVFADLSKRLVTEDTSVDFIELIEKVATSTGVFLEIRSVAKNSVEKDAENITELNLDIQTSGSWANTITFLRSLEALPYKVHIDRTSIRYKDSSGEGESFVPSSWELTSSFGVSMKS